MRLDDSFDYFLNRNGLNECDNIITKDYVSPFSYNDQVDYYQYGGTKDITGDPSKLSEIIYYIHKIFQKCQVRISIVNFHFLLLVFYQLSQRKCCAASYMMILEYYEKQDSSNLCEFCLYRIFFN